MRGFDSSSYGDAFADVYDEWYADVSDIDATVVALRTLGGDGPYLELGVGTGRLALALAASGADVTGIDSSTAMLDRLRAKASIDTASGFGSIASIHGDMIGDLPDATFAVVVIAYNTVFSLGSAELQQRLFFEVAERLQPGGSFVVEAAVPDSTKPAGSTVGLRSLSADRVVLSIDVHDPHTQIVEGQFVEITEASGVRLRPWRIRYCSVEELDEMAAAAGLVVSRRWESMRRDEFTPDSPSHVSVYSRRDRAEST